MQVNQKMIMTLTASIMYYCLQKQESPDMKSLPEDSSMHKTASCSSLDDTSSIAESVSNLTLEDDTTSLVPSESGDVGSTIEVTSNSTMDDATSNGKDVNEE
jgi:plastin-1